MKTLNYNRLFKTVCGIFAAASLLTSCKVEAPEIPAEEIYLRNFIKQYGLIDPEQDFICAKQSSITLNIRGYVEEVNVYAKVGDYYYRVAYYAQLQGTVEIPVDIPEDTPELLVDVDGRRFYAKPGSSIMIDRTAKSRADSEDYVAEWISWPTSLKKVGIGSNGALTGDCLVTVGEATYFNVQQGAKVSEDVVKDQLSISNTELGSTAHFYIENNNSTPSTYVLNFSAINFNRATLNVAIIDSNGLYYLNQDVNLRKFGDTSLNYNSPEAEVFEFSTALMPAGDYELVITVVDVPHDPDGRTSGGQWGNFTLKKSQEVKDMAWLMVAEDLGSTDDFDFNDIIVRIESVNLNHVAVERLGLNKWQVIEDKDNHINLHAPSRYDLGTVTKLKITAMCAGGVLPLWLHYKESDRTDYIIKPNATEEDSRVEASQSGMDDYEWHKWFGSSAGQMINTGISAHLQGASTTLLVSGYSMERFSFIDYDGTFDKINGDIEDVADWEGLVQGWRYLTENPAACINGFYITVNEPTLTAADSHLSALPKGIPPQMFLIPDCSPTESSGYSRHYGWEWPMERISILQVYPGFKDWVNHAGTSHLNPEGNWEMTTESWFMNPIPGIIEGDMLLYSRDPNHSNAGQANWLEKLKN